MTNKMYWKRELSLVPTSAGQIIVSSTMRMKIRPKRKHQNQNNVKKFNVDTLQDISHVQKFQQKLQEQLPQQIPPSVEEHWNQLKSAVITSCKETIGFKTKKNQDWFDDNDDELQRLIRKWGKLSSCYKITNNQLPKGNATRNARLQFRRSLEAWKINGGGIKPRKFNNWQMSMIFEAFLMQLKPFLVHQHTVKPLSKAKMVQLSWRAMLTSMLDGESTSKIFSITSPHSTGMWSTASQSSQLMTPWAEC